jgi:menaquinone-dependent protoporphyrinogen oxidase
MKKVLVTYASEHGSTAQIAQTIAKVLRQFDLDVTAKRMEAIENISGYEAIVLGTAIYMGDWLPEAKNFLEIYQGKLAQLPIWIFSSGPTGSDDPVKLLHGELVPAELQSIIEAIEPREIHVFHGKIDLRRLSPAARDLIKAAAVPRGDYRDWTAIKLWASEINRALTTRAITVPRVENSVPS